jgi:branched-chain amino acid transport system permease protein
VLGAAALILLEEFIPEALALIRPGWGEHWKIVLGPLLLGVVLFARQGLLGLLPAHWWAAAGGGGRAPLDQRRRR